MPEEQCPLTERQEKVIRILKRYLKMAEDGELLNVFIAADHLDNNYRGIYSTSEDVYSLMGYVIGLATSALCYQLDPTKGGDDE